MILHIVVVMVVFVHDMLYNRGSIDHKLDFLVDIRDSQVEGSKTIKTRGWINQMSLLLIYIGH